MKYLRIRRPVLFCTLLWLALRQDRTGLVRIGLLAAVLHECGHVIVFAALTGELPVLRLSGIGIGLDMDGVFLNPGQRLALAAAGPLMNFLLCGLTILWMQLRASYWGWCFAAANFALGLFNLLPVGCLDGHEIWKIAVFKGLHLLRK